MRENAESIAFYGGEDNEARIAMLCPAPFAYFVCIYLHLLPPTSLRPSPSIVPLCLAAPALLQARLLGRRLGAAVANAVEILKASRNLAFFTSFYRFLIQVILTGRGQMLAVPLMFTA